MLPGRDDVLLVVEIVARSGPPVNDWISIVDGRLS
jgi:hypothetical protein